MEKVIRSYLNDLLELGDETLQDDNNLIEYGLNSLALMFILEKLSVRTKKKLNYAEFVNDPTIKSWVEIIEKAPLA
ncbi:hypothetical protein MC118_003598 [Salmonella enterica]|nr:hypothetical protein [Salmonella enterica]